MTMLAERYELKFPVTTDECRRVLRAARAGLVPDAHGRDATYRIASLYFDTADHAAYWEKVDGERRRSKFRLRYYSVDDPVRGIVGTAFMEIKHRVGNMVLKERVRLTPDGGRALLENPGLLRDIERHTDPADGWRRATLAAIARAASLGGFGGACVITYVRQAWEGSRDRRLRVTVDTDLRALRPSGAFDVAPRRGASLLAADRAILEVKFDGAIPRWLRDVLAGEGVRLERFSKYARGVEVLGLASATAVGRTPRPAFDLRSPDGRVQEPSSSRSDAR